MEVLSEANYAMAGGGCYQCTNPGLGVSFDASIVGEGGLYLCRNCLFDAANLLGWEQDKGLQRSLDQTLERLSEALEQLAVQDKLVQTLNKAYQLHKAREVKGGKRSDSGGDPVGLGDVGLGALAPSADNRPSADADRGTAGPAGGEEPGAVQGDSVDDGPKPVRVVPRA